MHSFRRFVAASALLIALLFSAQGAHASQVTGTLSQPNSGQPLSNATLILTLSQAGVISGTSSVATSPFACHTSTDGSVVGFPNPQTAPSTSTNLLIGSLTAGTYGIKFTYYTSYDAGVTKTESLPSPAATVLLPSTGTIVVNPPSTVNGALGYGIYASLNGGTYQLVGYSIGFVSYNIAVLPAPSTPIPTSNLTRCQPVFNDTLIPSGTSYRVVVTDVSGRPVPGYPQTWYLAGSSYNVSTSLPLSSNPSVRFPEPVLKNPGSNGTQSVAGPITTNGYKITAGALELPNNATPPATQAGRTFIYTAADGTAVICENGGQCQNIINVFNACQAQRQSGATAGDKIEACVDDLPSIGGTIDARGIEGANTWASCPFDSVTKPLTVWLGAATHAIAVNCTIPPNVTLEFAQGAKLSPTGGTTLTIEGDIQGGLSQHFTGAGSVIIDSYLIPEIYPQWWGAVGDGVTDSTVAIQAALFSINSIGTVTNGGSIFFPPGTYITSSTLLIKNNTHIHGPAWSMVISGPYPVSCIKSVANTPVLSPATDPSWAVQITDLCFKGTALSGSRGISASTTTSAWTVRDVFFDNFGDSAFALGSGTGGHFENIFAQNSLMVRSGRTDYVGVIDLAIHDAVWINVAGTASVIGTGTFPGTGAIGSGFITGLVNRGTAGFMFGCVGHISQTGIVIAGDLIRVVGSRADLNQGHGFVIVGGQNTFVENLAYRNSRDTTATYSGFRILEARNTFSANQVIDASGDAIVQLYGFYDSSTSSGGVTVASNRYNENRSDNLSGGTYNFSGATLKAYAETIGSSFTLSHSVTTPQIKSSGSAPAVATGSATGSGGSASVSGTDLAGTLTVTTGTGSPSGPGRIVLVTYAAARAAAPKGIILQPANQAAAGLAVGAQAYPLQSTASTTTFEIANGATALTDSTTYVWNYVVIE